MSSMNDFAVVATVLAKPSFTLSIMLGGSSEVEVEAAAALVLLGAWSPANLEGGGVSMGLGHWEEEEDDLLIRHDDEKAFGGIFVGL